MIDVAKFEKRLLAAGAEILAPTNPYELLRFKSCHGVGVIYTGRRGQKLNAEALLARDHLDGGKGSLAPVKISARKSNKAKFDAIAIRDGDGCFFCGKPLNGDASFEHLVPLAHGGPNHMSNLFLSHEHCNREAGHLSAPEKVAMAIARRSVK